MKLFSIAARRKTAMMGSRDKHTESIPEQPLDTSSDDSGDSGDSSSHRKITLGGQPISRARMNWKKAKKQILQRQKSAESLSETEEENVDYRILFAQSYNLNSHAASLSQVTIKNVVEVSFEMM